MAQRYNPNSTAKKLHTVLTPRQDSEVRRIVHIIFGEAFGLSREKVVAMGQVTSTHNYGTTLDNHADLIAPMVTLFRSLVTEEKLKTRRVLNKELQDELEARNGRALEIIDARLQSEDEDKQWSATTEILKRNAPVKTIQKHEVESVKTIYSIPVGPARRRHLVAKPLQLEAKPIDVTEAEIVDDSETN